MPKWWRDYRGIEFPGYLDRSKPMPNPEPDPDQIPPFNDEVTGQYVGDADQEQEK